jgi:hypothetical protein
MSFEMSAACHDGTQARGNMMVIVVLILFLSSPFLSFLFLLPEPAGTAGILVEARSHPDRKYRETKDEECGIVYYRGFHSWFSGLFLLFLQMPFFLWAPRKLCFTFCFKCFLSVTTPVPSDYSLSR